MRRLFRLGMVVVTVMLSVLAGIQMMSVSPALAATINEISVTCRFVSVSGKTEVNAPYVRVQVVLGSNLTTVIAQQVVSTRPRAGAAYRTTLDIRKAHLAEGTHVVISVGEWDGTQYLRPATITGADCNRSGGSIPPTPVPSATFVGTLPPTFTPVASPTFIPVSPTPPPTPTPHPY